MCALDRPSVMLYANVKVYFVLWNSLMKEVESVASSVIVEGPVETSFSSALQLVWFVESHQGFI